MDANGFHRLRPKRDDLRFIHEFETLNDDSTLTPQEVALWLRVSPGWVRSHANGQRRPHLPSEKFGKYIRFRWGRLKIWRQSMERLV